MIWYDMIWYDIWYEAPKLELLILKLFGHLGYLNILTYLEVLYLFGSLQPQMISGAATLLTRSSQLNPNQVWASLIDGTAWIPGKRSCCRRNLPTRSRHFFQPTLHWGIPRLSQPQTSHKSYSTTSKICGSLNGAPKVWLVFFSHRCNDVGMGLPSTPEVWRSRIGSCRLMMGRLLPKKSETLRINIQSSETP